MGGEGRVFGSLRTTAINLGSLVSEDIDNAQCRGLKNNIYFCYLKEIVHSLLGQLWTLQSFHPVLGNP
jgi:hypothetical protein